VVFVPDASLPFVEFDTLCPEVPLLFPPVAATASSGSVNFVALLMMFNGPVLPLLDAPGAAEPRDPVVGLLGEVLE
jgi:hypothetical protein